MTQHGVISTRRVDKKIISLSIQVVLPFGVFFFFFFREFKIPSEVD